jgi:lipoate-protein ligase A
MVRRMTGGGGILHGQELTYSIVCRQEDLGTKDVKPLLSSYANS